MTRKPLFRSDTAKTIALTALLCATSALMEDVAIASEPAEGSILRTHETTAATCFQFSKEDEALLDSIERGCFQYFWQEVGTRSMLAKDRKKADVCSVAAVGFQLSSLPIGVERGWISHAQGARRAKKILTSLIQGKHNRKHGVYLHFIDLDTGNYLPDWTPNPTSTVDHALLLAGALPAAVYFGGDVAKRVDQMLAATNWKAYDVSERGLISFGWLPDKNGEMAGPGEFMALDWRWASDEERIVYFLAVAAPKPEFAVEPTDYYRLERIIKRHDAMPPHVVSWNGLLFTYFFSHCWIDYRGLDADDPTRFGITAPRVDWYENSRRAVLTHRQRCIEMANKYTTLGPNRWGLSPCTGRDNEGKDSYLVQNIRPNISNGDDWQGATVAPYAAGTSIMFTPKESMDALREFRSLRGNDGKLLAWQDPDEGGYGLVDSFNLDQQYASDDTVGIDVGPMLLAIENVRSGLIWKLFMQHPAAQRALEKLRLTPLVPSPRE